MLADIVFRLDLPHGRCVGVRVPTRIEEASLHELPNQERVFFETLSPARKPTWLAGRIAMHAALADLGIDHGPILAKRQGAPELPDGVAGSISHKRTLAVALAARRVDGLSLGVDIEPIPAKPSLPSESGWDNRPDISSRVMTPDELAALDHIPEEARRREVVLHFSIKEALYKAIHPLVGRYVSFQEAIVHPYPDGSVDVTLALSKGEGPFVAESRWIENHGHLLVTAAIRPGARGPNLVAKDPSVP